jgi:hypothetical protein
LGLSCRQSKPWHLQVLGLNPLKHFFDPHGAPTMQT